MNETERIIEDTGYSRPTPITWLYDPTRHLLKIKAVNAKDSIDPDAQQSPSGEPPPDETNRQNRAD